MKYLIQGYYGFGNIGDDLMAQIIAKRIMADGRGNRADILVNGNETGWLLDGLPSGVSIVQASNRLKFARLMSQYDCLVQGGGTCLHEYGFAGFDRNMIAKALGKQVFWIGIGMNPIRSFKSKIKACAALACCDGITFRDQESSDLLGEQFPWFARKSVTADLIWLASASSLHARKVQPRTLLVSWGYRLHRQFGQSWAERDRDDAIRRERLCKAIGVFCARHDFKKVQVSSMAVDIDPPANEAIYRRLLQILPSSIELNFLSPSSSAEAVDLILNSSMAIMGRLHPFMLAKLNGLPCVTWEYASKITNFRKMLNQPNFLTDSVLMEGDILARLEAEFASPSSLSVDIQQMRSRSIRNFDLIF